MPHYVGPCQECGVHIDRMLRPGRLELCVECAIERQLAHNRSMAEGDNPDLELCRQAGRDAGDAILSRRGRTYEKWLNGMIRAIADRDAQTA